jgi:hypothetical protein
MRGREDIRKFTLGSVIPPVLRTLVKKPKLFLPFLIPALLTILSGLVQYVIIAHLDDIELPWIAGSISRSLYGEGYDWIGLLRLWTFSMMFVSLLAGIIISAWAIQSYWTYYRMGDLSLVYCFKKGMRYFYKMLGARILVFLILLIPLMIPQIIWNIFIAQLLEPSDYIYWGYFTGIPVALYSIALSVPFIFIFHSIIIEKTRVIGSLKRSVKVAWKNYWKLFIIILIPYLLYSLLGLVIIISLRIGLWPNFISGIWSYLIPGINGFIIHVVGYSVLGYSLTRAYILSIMKTRRTRDKWGFRI